MQYTTIALGSFIIMFGLFTLVGSIRSPQDLVRLKYMREKLGHKAGTLVHALAYIIVPLIFGFFMLRAGLNGITISEFITQ